MTGEYTIADDQMLTAIEIQNFKRFDDVRVELGDRVVLIGPNNGGKTTVLQALALWDVAARKLKGERKSRVTLNRRDIAAVPIQQAGLLWRNRAEDVPSRILVEGVTLGSQWHSAITFTYANEESFYGSSSGHWTLPDLLPVVAFLPSMSGLIANEDRLERGAINVRIGEGRTAEVLRNLCYLVATTNPPAWQEIVRHLGDFFGVVIGLPVHIAERGEIRMSYVEPSGVELDLTSSGRGMQQTLLLLAHLYANPGSVLLLDEPDAHLEIIRQRQIYQLLTNVAEQQRSQIIAASHSEVILNEAAGRDIVIAFVGKPHRIDDRGSQLVKALKEIGFDQYYQAELVGWVLYLEGSTDLAILKKFADLLDHPVRPLLDRVLVHYVGNQPGKARDHFFGLREAKADLVGFALFDRLGQTLNASPPLHLTMWKRNEIENYVATERSLLAFAEAASATEGAEGASRVAAMRDLIAQISVSSRTLRRPEPFTADIKASTDFLDPLFAGYYDALGQPNLMMKTAYHVLVDFLQRDEIDSEVVEILDQIQRVAASATPRHA